MKNALLTSVIVLSALISAKNTQATEIEYTGQLGVGLLSTENAMGYTVNASWTPSSYIQLKAGLNSSRDDRRFNVAQLEQLKINSTLTDDERDALFDEFGNKEYAPRNNEFYYAFVAMYPFRITNHFVVSPYAELGQVRNTTKSISVSKSSSSTSTTGAPGNQNSREYHFPSTNAFYVGAGFKLNVNTTHLISLGLISYANGSDWRNFDVSKDYRGGVFEYQARYHRLSFMVSAESTDMFGDPRLKTGVAINF